jgi:nudix-type nucleoside diphosphatase (YffH/AdpP family)
VHDSGDGATILLYNLIEETFLITRQFRLPTFLTGNTDGMMLECCAGIVENESPEQAIKREILEELGYEIEEVKYLYSAYATPGAKTEKIYFFFAPYDHEMKKQKGGGKAEEHEEIEIVELKFQDAFQMIKDGSICDAKTIILLLQFRLDFGL